MVAGGVPSPSICPWPERSPPPPPHRPAPCSAIASAALHPPSLLHGCGRGCLLAGMSIHEGGRRPGAAHGWLHAGRRRAVVAAPKTLSLTWW
jgi:hypothetical protein